MEVFFLFCFWYFQMPHVTGRWRSHAPTHHESGVSGEARRIRVSVFKECCSTSVTRPRELQHPATLAVASHLVARIADRISLSSNDVLGSQERGAMFIHPFRVTFRFLILVDPFLPSHCFPNHLRISNCETGIRISAVIFLILVYKPFSSSILSL